MGMVIPLRGINPDHVHVGKKGDKNRTNKHKMKTHMGMYKFAPNKLIGFNPMTKKWEE